MSIQAVTIRRYQVSRGFKKDDLNPLIDDPNVSCIQFSSPLAEKEIDVLEEFVFSKRPDIGLRVFGHHGEECDLRFLKRMPSLRNISADYLINAKGIEVVSEFKDLESLSVGIFELNNFDFLNEVNPNLKKLSLHQTRSTRPRIDAIGRLFNSKNFTSRHNQKA